MTGEQAGAAPRRGGVLREGYDYDFSRCDPATGAHVDPAWCAIYETVTLAGPDGRLGPMLADRWRVSDDGLEWRLHVPPGARYHSGAPCDAAAVAAAFGLHSDPVASPVNAFFWGSVRQISSDGDDVVISLRGPNVGLPRLLRSWHSAIHNEATRRDLGDAYGHVTADGTGPFRFHALEPGEVFEVRRFDEYPGSPVAWFENHGAAHLDAIRWIPLLDEEGRADALEQGLVDCIQNPSLLHVDRLTANPELRVITFQQPSLAYLALDHQTTEKHFDDVRVRRALSLAIDREALVAQDLGGHGWPAYGPIPSQAQWYEPGVEALGGYDPAEAVALLDAAGLAAGADGVRLRFSALILEDSAVRRAAAHMQAMFRAVGVELELRPIAGFQAFYGSLGDHPEAFISKWFWPDPMDAIIGFVSSWSHAGPNWQRASIPALDDACRAWQTAPDEATQARAARALQLESAASLPLIPLFSPAAVWAHHRRVHGWQPLAANLYPLYNDVWLGDG